MTDLPEGTWGYHKFDESEKFRLWQVYDGKITHIGVIEADEACANFICERLNEPSPALIETVINEFLAATADEVITIKPDGSITHSKR